LANILKENFKGIFIGVYSSAAIDFHGCYSQYRFFIYIGGLFPYYLIKNLIPLKLDFFFLVHKQFLLRKYPLFPFLRNILLLDYCFDLIFFIEGNSYVIYVIIFGEFGFIIYLLGDILIFVLMES